MMRSIFGIFLVLLTAMPQVSAQLNSYSRAELAFDNALTGYNPGFESGTVKWTASGGTFAVNSGTQFVPGSKQFASWDSNSASQEVCSSLVKVPESGNCSVGLEYRVPSGTATHKIVAKDGSKDLSVEDVVLSTAAWRHDVEFPCAAAASNQARVCLRSVASDEPAIQLDGGYVGYARNVGTVAQARLVADAYKAGAASCGWSRTNTAIGDFGTDADCPAITVVTNGGVCSITTTDDDLPQIVLTNCPAGNYQVFASLAGSFSTGTPVLTWTLSDGTSTSGTVATMTDGTVTPNVTLAGSFTYTDAGSRTFRVQGAASVNSIIIDNTSATRNRLSFQVYYFPTSQQQVVMSDAQGWFASGTITGANPSISSPTSSWRETTNASLTMVQNPGSATVGIPCASGTTNTFGALTCASANESIGIEVNAPRSGAYEVCAQGSVGIADSFSGTNGLANFAFAPNLTSAGSSTVVTQSTHSANVLMSTGDLAQITNVHYSFNVCSTFVLSAGRNTFRLMNEGTETGTIASIIVADGDAGAGNRGITFTVKPVTAQQQAILANSVSTDVTNGLKVTTTRFTTTTGPNACVVGGSIDNSWISGTPTSSGAGQCSFTMTGFSAQPDCQFTLRSSPSGISVSGNTSSATAGGFQIWDALGASTTGSVVVTCIGPR